MPSSGSLRHLLFKDTIPTVLIISSQGCKTPTAWEVNLVGSKMKDLLISLFCYLFDLYPLFS